MHSLDAPRQSCRDPGEEHSVAVACGCGRPGCDGCALTPRTVYLLGAELAWLADMAHTDIGDIVTGRRSITMTVFAMLPEVALDWGARNPGWLGRYASAADQLESGLQGGRPIDPRSLAEEVLLQGALHTAGLEPEPDDALSPAGLVLPKLPGDYAWARAAEAVGFRPDLQVVYDGLGGPLIRIGDPLHPSRWFEPYALP